MLLKYVAEMEAGVMKRMFPAIMHGSVIDLTNVAEI